MIQCLARAHPSTSDSDDPEHLSFEQLSVRQIQRILEDSADAAMNLGRTKNDPICGAEIGEKPFHGHYGRAQRTAMRVALVARRLPAKPTIRTTTDSCGTPLRGALTS